MRPLVIALLLLILQSQAPVESPEERIVRINHLGIALMEQLRFENAAAEFAKIRELRPDLAFAHVNEGIALYNLQNYDAALEKFNRAIELDKDLIQARYMRGLLLRNRDQLAEAIADLEWVGQRDPDDPTTLYYLGLLYVRQQSYDRAIASFQRVLASEPYNASAQYNLAIALLRSGKREEGQQAMGAFRRLEELFGKQTQGVQYLEQGKYSAVVEDLPPALVAKATESPVEFRFDDATEAAGLPAAVTPPVALDAVPGMHSGGVALVDYDGDGDLDIYLTNDSSASGGKGGNQLYRNAGDAKFAVVESDVLAGPGSSTGCLWGDYDGDGFPDLALLTAQGVRLLHNEKGTAFRDVSESAKLKDSGSSSGGAFVDYDHDGDLDLFVTRLSDSPESAGALWRNNGDGTFADVFTSSKLIAPGRPAAFTFTDFNNSRDIDFVLGGSDPALALFSNQRDGTFKKVETKAGTEGPAVALQVLDFNQDGWMDLWLATGKSSVLLRNVRGKEYARVEDFPATAARAGLAVDIDNDGDVDLITAGPAGLKLLANSGHRFSDATAKCGLEKFSFAAKSLSAGDIDGDGDLDLVASEPAGRLRLLKNNGANQNRWLAVKLKGTNSNRSALGTKVEARAGSWWQKLEINGGAGGLGQGQPLAHFGLGRRERVELLRILWPGGVLQSEFEAAGNQTLAVTELDRKGTSCPILYAWDGKKYQFVTDFLGGSAFGYLLAPGQFNFPDSDEYIKLDRNRVGLRDGRISLAMTNQLEEVIFIDQARLVAIDHPAAVEVFPDEKLLPGPPYAPFGLIFSEQARPPARARDGAGRDLLPEVSRVDRVYAGGFANLPFKGYAETHTLELDLGDLSRAASIHLLMHAWIDYADSTSNLAAWQAGQALAPPTLEVSDGRGGWKMIGQRMGFPAGLPKTMTVDLTGKFPAADYRVRITTNMRIYWDQILVSTGRRVVPHRITPLDAASARLQWKGYPRPFSPDGRQPLIYDYDASDDSAGWKTHTGEYTRYGDVRVLVEKIDDRFVILKHGDEIRLDFDPADLPALPSGWVRDYLVFADGFGKDMDIHSARPDAIEPLPFHAMKRYPYWGREAFPSSDKHQAWRREFNTRRVAEPFSRVP